MTTDISNSDDVIDSRDVIARIEELESDRDALQSALDDAKEALANLPPGAARAALRVDAKDAINNAQEELDAWQDSDDARELKALEALQDEAQGYCPDWRHGAALIRESYWISYCQEMLEDIGDIPRDLPGYIVIDWDATADNIRADYTKVDFDGVPYLIR